MQGITVLENIREIEGVVKRHTEGIEGGRGTIRKSSGVFTKKRSWHPILQNKMKIH